MDHVHGSTSTGPVGPATCRPGRPRPARVPWQALAAWAALALAAAPARAQTPGDGATAPGAARASGPEAEGRGPEPDTGKEWIPLDLDALDSSTRSSFEELLGMEVVSAATVAQKRSDASMTIYIVTDEQIRTRGYQTLEDILDDIPEIEIQNNAVNETRNAYSARGVSGNEKFLILLDGFRFNSPAGSPHIIGHNFPVHHARQVEIALGPASALYGVDAFAGVVNIITRPGAEQPGVAGELVYGSFNTADGYVHGGQRFDDVSVALAAYAHHSDGPDYPAAYPDDFRWYRDVYRRTGQVLESPFVPDRVVETGPPRPFDVASDAYFLQGRVDVGGFTFGYARSFERHSSSVGTQPEYAVYSADARIATNHVSAYASHTHRLPGDAVTLETSAHYATYDMLPTSRFINTYSGYYNGGYKYSTERSMNLDVQLNYRPAAWLSLTQGVSTSDISAVPKGADLPRPFDPTEAAETQNIPHVGTDVVDAGGNSLAVPVRFYHVNERSYGAYTEALVTPVEALRLTLGARYDQHERYGGTFNPRLGLVFKPRADLALRAHLATASLAPGPYRAFQNFGSFTVERDASNVPTGLSSVFWFVPNPELQPENIRSAEANVSWLPASFLGLDLRGHYIRVDDIINAQYVGGGTFEGIPTDTIGTHVNRGVLVSYGALARVEASLQPAPSLSLRPYVAYSYTSGEFRDTTADGDPLVFGLPFMARHTLKSGIDGAWRALSGSLRVNARSSTRNTTVNPILVAAPLVDVELALRYLVYDGPRWRLWAHVRVDNLLDSRYRHVMFSYDPTQFETVPQEPRQILFGLGTAMTP
jgi:iron complex outermembrane receptor protein